MAFLKLIVEFAAILIGAEGVRLLENALHFLRAVFFQGSQSNVQADSSALLQKKYLIK
ncbi:hypothetical protein [Bacillus sp. M6-12]|uniref:hypothetical protein n=1 Tax=Bacillus sp. M6-12 TaxID=2054166 RepID=UPI0015E08A55|nr:hypothetical protein [Bacillus sp. M6-12]